MSVGPRIMIVCIESCKHKMLNTLACVEFMKIFKAMRN